MPRLKNNSNSQEVDLFKYWKWFFTSGYKKILNRWLFLHLLISIPLSFIIPVSLNEAAKSVLLPLAGIFVGLSFAWSGNALALFQSPEIRKLASNKKGGYKDYLYTFQTAVLIIIITLVLWSIAGLSIIDHYICQNTISYFCIKVLLICFSSLTLRECWQVVLAVQWLLLAQKEIYESSNDESNNK